MTDFLINPWYKEKPSWKGIKCGAFGNEDVLPFHHSLPGYKPTPLVRLSGLAKALGIKELLVKDESKRFGVKAFKPLGASYSIYYFLKNECLKKLGAELSITDFGHSEKIMSLGSYTFCAATDGNHGRAVAWTARILGHKAIIYMPSDSAEARINSIKDENADVVLIDGTFDDCVRICDTDAETHGMQVVSDTAYEGYMEYPAYIMAGYSTIFMEMEQELIKNDKCTIDVVILQAGVGGLAAAGTWFFTDRLSAGRPKIICLEPKRADSFYQSALAGEPRRSEGDYNSIMAGLNCAVSLTAWPIIKEGVNAFLAISDRWAEHAMRRYYFTEKGDARIISGESGSSGLAGLLALCSEPQMKNATNWLGLGRESRVLLINSEGDTDPENFVKIVMRIE